MQYNKKLFNENEYEEAIEFICINSGIVFPKHLINSQILSTFSKEHIVDIANEMIVYKHIDEYTDYMIKILSLAEENASIMDIDTTSIADSLIRYIITHEIELPDQCFRNSIQVSKYLIIKNPKNRAFVDELKLHRFVGWYPIKPDGAYYISLFPMKSFVPLDLIIELINKHY